MSLTMQKSYNKELATLEKEMMPYLKRGKLIIFSVKGT